jgi:NAD(P)-dependent dehydrogenase (short-subunit alcohol dehydrogenase family)
MTSQQQPPQPSAERTTGRGVAVVTGGSAGVGRSAVRELAARGWDVAVLARGRAGTEAAVKEVEAAGRRGLAVRCDVADPQQVEDAADRVERELGPIDVWVNVAFSGSLRYFWDTDDESYRRMTEVTYFGQVNGVRTALRRMRPRDRGVVINVGSALAFRGIPLQSAYCGAKHAVKGFTESVVAELKHEGSKVRLCMVQLPGLNTPQFDWNDNQFESKHPQPVAPVFQPETAGRAIAFLAEHPRRNMWVGVSTAYTILGNRVAPWFLDWYLGKTGVSGQLTTEQGPRYGSNVFEARDDDADIGAHGMFDAKAHGSDPWSWTSMHRGPVAAAGLGVAAAAAGLVGALRRR